MASQPLILRADASVAMGTGHVMRCLALAQAWRDTGGTCVFAMQDSTAAIGARLQSEGMEVISIRAAREPLAESASVAKLAQHYGAAWVVVDGYQFDAEYQKSLIEAGTKVLWIDDCGHAAHYYADLVLNQNVHARPDVYQARERSTRLLLGPRYALLRREFSSLRNFRREIPQRASKVLVTMGGSDPDNVTLRVLEALRLAALGDSQVVVLIGGSNPHFEILDSAARALGAARLLRNAENMPELMSWADVAISAAGTTCWEMALLGVPAILVDVAENQRPVAEELSRRKIAMHAGNTQTADAATIARLLSDLVESTACRAEMCRRSQSLVDGRGAERVVAAIRSADLRLRKVEEGDCRLIWNWSNDPMVRKVSFSTDPIPWERHVQWFRSKLDNPNVMHHLVINRDGVPVGQVRYELDGPRAVMSINMAPEFRGCGYGNAIMVMATEALFRNSDASEIHAYVMPGNEPSLRLFAGAGFRREATVTMNGHEAVRFVLERLAQP